MLCVVVHRLLSKAQQSLFLALTTNFQRSSYMENSILYFINNSELLLASNQCRTVLRNRTSQVSALYPLGVRFELLRPRSKPVGAPGVLLRSPSLCIRSVSALYPLCIRSVYPLGVRSELLSARSQPVGAPVFLLSSHKRCVPALYPLCIRSECARNAL